MAFGFSFGKKDKNPPEVPAPVAKTPPTPPKIQEPPAIPAVKPPQPTGLMPASGKNSGTVTTQPMVMPRSGAPALSHPPPRPGTAPATRSTQRIVLPSGTPGTRPTSTKSLSMGTPAGRINLPIGMILRCLPPEVLAADLAEFETSGAAATEIGLPMNTILTQLPSGKVEIPLQDLVAHFPPGFLQPTDSITTYLPKLINLPLMDVVMRIPPDLLALRPDQKDVDASVINMADPFTEEILREQAEAARRQAQTNIIEESQAPQEEFVPQEQAGAAKSVAPPRRPPAEPLATRPQPKTALSISPPPIPQAPKLPTPPALSSLRSTSPGSLPTPSPSQAARTISPLGQVSIPTRATSAIPTRPQGAVTLQMASSQTAPPVPPVPRHTGSIPAPPAPRHTTSLPLPRPIGSPLLAPPMAEAAPAAPVVPAVPVAPPPVVAPPATSAQDTDDLQRLAALAMAQLGDSADTKSALPNPTVAPTEPDAAPVETPVAEAPEPEPVAAEPVATAPTVTEPVATAPIVAEPVVSEPVAAAPEPPAAPPKEEPAPEPEAEPAPVIPPIAVAAPPAPVETPEPVAAPVAAAPAPPAKTVEEPTAEQEAHPSSASVAFNLNTCTAEELVQNIPGCSADLAESIIQHRTKIGSFKRLEDLLDVPGITKAAYTNLTGEAPPENRIPLSLSELLGFPAEQNISLKDVTDRIACWPDVTGCVLSQSTGLSLVGTVPEGLDKAAIVAFAPRMFDALNKSFSEIAGKETDALIIPSAVTSFHIFRNKDLYLIIMSRLPQMPERHMKVARFVLSALSIRTE